jgi:hypothetical protein
VTKKYHSRKLSTTELFEIIPIQVKQRLGLNDL